MLRASASASCFESWSSLRSRSSLALRVSASCSHSHSHGQTDEHTHTHYHTATVMWLHYTNNARHCTHLGGGVFEQLVLVIQLRRHVLQATVRLRHLHDEAAAAARAHHVLVRCTAVRRVVVVVGVAAAAPEVQLLVHAAHVRSRARGEVHHRPAVRVGERVAVAAVTLPRLGRRPQRRSPVQPTRS
jgi:hypothetical protein